MKKIPKINLQLFGGKERPQRYFSMATEGTEVDIYIFGDIVSWEWLESDVSSYTLARAISVLQDVSVINVHINSYGGEVAEGLAILNSLQNHPAKIRTACDGFACSAASVVFMAGDERIMNPASLLMIHNAWGYGAGNADELRKFADDLETISATAAEAYKAKISISDEELDKLLKNESWIKPEDAVTWGFATAIRKAAQSDKPAASAQDAVMRKMLDQTIPAEVRITPELQKQLDEIKAQIAAGQAAIVLPKEPENPRPVDFLSAIFGRKE